MDGCSVRVSNELGARNPKSAAFSVVMVTLISFIISVIAAGVVLYLRDVISYAFTGGEVVAAAVSDLCPLLAFGIVLNGIQPVLSGQIPFKIHSYIFKLFLINLLTVYIYNILKGWLLGVDGKLLLHM